MPRDGSAGYSQWTAVKQEHFENVARTFLTIVQRILKRRPWASNRSFCYVDLNAGPGLVNGRPGSPLVFLNQAAELGVPVEAWLCEQDQDSLQRLEQTINAWLSARPAVSANVHYLLGD